jgi:hypothetical protein
MTRQFSVHMLQVSRLCKVICARTCLQCQPRTLVDVASFMHDKAVPNSVTVCTGKISHKGTSSNMPEFEYMKSLVPEAEWKNIKLTVWTLPLYNVRVTFCF